MLHVGKKLTGSLTVHYCFLIKSTGNRKKLQSSDPLNRKQVISLNLLKELHRAEMDSRRPQSTKYMISDPIGDGDTTCI